MDAKPDNDLHELSRFVAAQEDMYERVLKELLCGQKRSHWMWYVFPQMAGLGSSPTARFYAIKFKAEAEAYLHHPVLGPRLVRCAEALLGHQGKSAREIMGSPDDIKLRSSVTLFAKVSGPGSTFEKVLERYFAGQPDERTLAILADR